MKGKKLLLSALAALTVAASGCSLKRSLSLEQKVRAFLQQSDVKQSYTMLKITETKNLPRDYIKVYAEFVTGQSYHPLDDTTLSRPSVQELHKLEMIIDEKPLDGSGYKVIYARDRNYWGSWSEPGKGIMAEADWNYITMSHIIENHYFDLHDFDKTTPEKDIVWNGDRYYPVICEQFPEISDYDKSKIEIIGQKDGYEIYGLYDTREHISSVPSQDMIIIPENMGFYIWSQR